MANSFQEYYQFNIKIALDRTVLQRIEKKSGEQPATRLRKPMFIWSIMHQKGLRVLLPPMLPHQLDLISNIISSLKHLTEPLIREVGWTKPCPFMRENRKYTLLPMPMVHLYAYLLERKLVTPMFQMPREGPLQLGFDPSKKCKHHFRAKGHTLEECS